MKIRHAAKWAFPVVIIIVFSAVLSSCSSPVGQFFSRQYDYLITYFNAFYNAEIAYDDAMKDVQLAIDQSDNLDPLDYLTLTPTSRQKFNPVIEKCSKILQFHDQSSLVDQALFLIGMSYFYQEDYLKADRKFQELITTHPESDYFSQARLWWARTKFKDRRPQEALQDFAKLIEDLKDDSKDIRSEAWRSMGYIYASQQNWKDAIAAYKNALDLAQDKINRSAIAYRLGLLDEKIPDYASAADAYKIAYNGSLPVLKEGDARIRYGRCLSLMQRYDDADDAFATVTNDRSYKDVKGLAEVERANSLKRQGRLNEAIKEYTRIDTVYRGTEAAMVGYYELGELYEDSLRMPVLAQKAYSDSKSQISKVELTANAIYRSTLLSRFNQLTGEIRLRDSVMFIQDSLRADTSYMNWWRNDSTQKALAAIQKAREDSLKKEDLKRSLALKDSLSKVPPAPQAMNERDSSAMKPKSDSVKLNLDSIVVHAQDAAIRARVDSLYGTKEDLAAKQRRDSISKIDPALLSEEDLGPEHFERARIARERSQAMAQRSHGRDTVGMKPTPVDSISIPPDSLKYLFEKKIKDSVAAIPKLQLVSRDSIRALIGRSEYELGILLFLDFSKTDSAITILNRALTDGPKEPYIPQILYLFGTLLDTSKTSERVKRDSLYSIILDKFPKSTYADQVRVSRGMALSKDLKDTAAVFFRNSELLIKAAKYDSAFAVLDSIIKKFPHSPFVPKSMYLIAWTYAHDLKNIDSATSVYKQLTERFAGSDYATPAKGFLSAVAEEKTRIDSIHKADSLLAHPPAKTKSTLDSSKAGSPPTSIDSVSAAKQVPITNPADSLQQHKANPLDSLQQHKTMPADSSGKSEQQLELKPKTNVPADSLELKHPSNPRNPRRVNPADSTNPKI